jgi:hypothetical protein
MRKKLGGLVTLGKTGACYLGQKNRQMFNFVSFYAKLKISKEAEPRKR